MRAIIRHHPIDESRGSRRSSHPPLAFIAFLHNGYPPLRAPPRHGGWLPRRLTCEGNDELVRPSARRRLVRRRLWHAARRALAPRRQRVLRAARRRSDVDHVPPCAPDAPRGRRRPGEAGRKGEKHSSSRLRATVVRPLAHWREARGCRGRAVVRAPRVARASSPVVASAQPFAVGGVERRYVSQRDVTHPPAGLLILDHSSVDPIRPSGHRPLPGHHPLERRTALPVRSVIVLPAVHRATLFVWCLVALRS